MNGFNFIDGLNGLSSFNFITIFVSIYFLAGLYQDEEIKNWSMFLIFLHANSEKTSQFNSWLITLFDSL